MYKIKEFFKLFSRDMKRFFRRSQKRIAAMPQAELEISLLLYSVYHSNKSLILYFSKTHAFRRVFI